MADAEISSPFPLTALSDELLIVVFERLAESSEHSLRACSGVCHRFYKLATPIVWRDSVHTSTSDWHFTTRRLLNRNSRIPLFVRSVLLDDRQKNGSDDAEQLIDVIHVTTNVREIEMYGSYQISQRLLDEINARLPKAKLTFHAEFPREEDGYYQGWYPEGPLGGGMSGFSSPQLHSLRMDQMWSVDDQGHIVVQRSLEKIIKTCLNLRHLTTYSGNGYGKWNGVDQELDLHLSSTDTVPVLESFCYVPLSPKTLQIWGEVAGWSSLKVLKIGRLDLLSVFGKFRLPQLQSLTISTGGDKPEVTADGLDALPLFRAPIQFLAVEHLRGNRIPHMFLRQFSQTLEELAILNSGQDSDLGYSSIELQSLNNACPRLRKLCIRPYIIQTSSNWSHSIIKEISDFPYLQHLVLFLPSKAERPPTAILCEETYKSIHTTNPNSRLSRLGVGNQFNTVYEDAFEYVLWQAEFSCRKVDGILKVTKKQPRYWDYGNFNACKSEAVPKLLVPRPLTKLHSRGWRIALCEKDIMWCAKQLGPGPKWAEDELLPQGLMCEEDFKDSWTPGNGNFEADVKKLLGYPAEIMRYRKLVTEELRYWKRRRELQDAHGRYYWLYDVLYPLKKEDMV